MACLNLLLFTRIYLPNARPADEGMASMLEGRLDAAVSLKDALRTPEVNSLRVNGDQVEALDVLVVMEPEGASRTEQAT